MSHAVGEPLNTEAWEWYHTVVGEGRCTVVDTWWQTGEPEWQWGPPVCVRVPVCVCACVCACVCVRAVVCTCNGRGVHVSWAVVCTCIGRGVHA